MFYPVIRSLLFALDAEKSHELTLKLMKKIAGTPAEFLIKQEIKSLPIQCMGLTLPNRLGLAAGLDKNGECIDAFASMGFGFIEVGTVTPLAQPGNDLPRLFRLPDANGIINRMGFNNHGVDQLIANINKSAYKGILGINIGKNKDTPVEYGKDDYLVCMDKTWDKASYLTINISSPNTPGLRSLQYGEALDDLLIAVKQKQAQLTSLHAKYVPVAIKIAPDLSEQELIQVADSLVSHKIDAVIATNTTLDRSLIEGLPLAREAGGLSGRPLQSISTQVIKIMHRELKGALPIIGVGGIDSAIAAKEKINAGATLLQVYSGFIYYGPQLLKKINKFI